MHELSPPHFYCYSDIRRTLQRLVGDDGKYGIQWGNHCQNNPAILGVEHADIYLLIKCNLQQFDY